jgi:hypothetical protein
MKTTSWMAMGVAMAMAACGTDADATLEQNLVGTWESRETPRVVTSVGAEAFESVFTLGRDGEFFETSSFRYRTDATTLAGCTVARTARGHWMAVGGELVLARGENTLEQSGCVDAANNLSEREATGATANLAASVEGDRLSLQVTEVDVIVYVRR